MRLGVVREVSLRVCDSCQVDTVVVAALLMVGKFLLLSLFYRLSETLMKLSIKVQTTREDIQVMRPKPRDGKY